MKIMNPKYLVTWIQICSLHLLSTTDHSCNKCSNTAVSQFCAILLYYAVLAIEVGIILLLWSFPSALFPQNIDQVVVSRLYLALVLLSLLKETDLWSVADRFQLSRGFIQTLLSSSSVFCSCVLHFTEVATSIDVIYDIIGSRPNRATS